MTLLELYGASHCPFTGELREQLEWEGRTFVEYDVDTDAAARERLVTITGGRMVPALVEDGRVVAVGWRGRGCAV
jgi:mycoredoxin